MFLSVKTSATPVNTGLVETCNQASCFTRVKNLQIKIWCLKQKFVYLFMLTFFLILLFFVLGLMLRPRLSKYIRKQFADFFDNKHKNYEVEFRIEFYNQPSLHHIGEKGVLVKSPPIQIYVEAIDEEDALNILESIIRQEVKGELISIKEISE